MKDYQTLNSQIIDSWCESGWQWGQSIALVTAKRKL